jgi:ribosomal protein S13
MTPSKKLHTGIASVAVVGLAAAGAAVAANKLHSTKAPQQSAAGSFVAASSGTKSGAGPDHHGPGFRHSDLADAASYLGISQTALETALQSGKTLAQVADATSGKSAAGLIDALVTAEKSELAAAVKAGELTQAQADQLTANLKAHETAEVNGTFRGHGPGGPGDRHGGHGHGDGLAAAATYLGITQNALLTQLQSGKTLAQIADATSGKSTAGLVAALVAAEKTELAAAVKAGDLTQAQADQISSGVQARVTALVNGTRPAHDGRGDHDGPNGFRPRPTATGTHI